VEKTRGATSKYLKGGLFIIEKGEEKEGGENVARKGAKQERRLSGMTEAVKK